MTDCSSSSRDVCLNYSSWSETLYSCPWGKNQHAFLNLFRLCEDTLALAPSIRLVSVWSLLGKATPNPEVDTGPQRNSTTALPPPPSGSEAEEPRRSNATRAKNQAKIHFTRQDPDLPQVAALLLGCSIMHWMTDRRRKCATVWSVCGRERKQNKRSGTFGVRPERKVASRCWRRNEKEERMDAEKVASG